VTVRSILSREFIISCSEEPRTVRPPSMNTKLGPSGWPSKGLRTNPPCSSLYANPVVVLKFPGLVLVGLPPPPNKPNPDIKLQEVIITVQQSKNNADFVIRAIIFIVQYALIVVANIAILINSPKKPVQSND